MYHSGKEKKVEKAEEVKFKNLAVNQRLFRRNGRGKGWLIVTVVLVGERRRADGGWGDFSDSNGTIKLSKANTPIKQIWSKCSKMRASFRVFTLC